MIIIESSATITARFASVRFQQNVYKRLSCELAAINKPLMAPN